MTDINIELPYEAFDNHFAAIDNQRILFSAPFGSGKTYFLDKYFKEQNLFYNSFWLSPVNYVVSQNEDIFEYIKYDLARQLLGHKEIKDQLKKKIGEDQFVYQYIVNNPKDIFKLLFSALENAPTELLGIPDPLTKAVNKAGKFGGTFIDTLNKYQEYKDKINKHLEPIEGILSKYIQDSNDIKGSIFEYDFMSQMVKRGIEEVCKDKKSVLVIDDLDRLDPEHIFRILNILSVHQDRSQSKFGFDKIIIVCDKENIHKIYKHKYGETVDFNGYIEKFYSTNVFSFSNEQAVALYCYNELNLLLSKHLIKVLGVLLAYFVNKGRITVRSLVKHNIKANVNEFTLVEGKISNYNKDGRYKVFGVPNYYTKGLFFITSASFEVLILIKILINVFGSFNNLKSEIKAASNDRDVINHDIIIEAIKLFAPMQLLAEKYNDHEKLSVTIDKDRDYPQLNPLIVTGPSVTVFHIYVGLQLKWNKDNLYIGQENLYSSDDELISEEHIKNFINNSNGKISKITYNDVFSILDGFLSFINNNNFTHNLA